MGKVWSSASRYVKNINIENRAQRALDKQSRQTVAAPRHQTKKAENYARNDADDTVPMSNLLKKDEQLLSHLKDIKVDTFGPPPQIRSSRPLPESRSNVETPEFGVQEPSIIPVGKISIRQAMEMITNHHSSPKEYNSTLIAKDYKLDEAVVQKVLKHFQTLNIHIPKQVFKEDKNLLEKLGVQKKPSLEEKNSGLKTLSDNNPNTKNS